MEEPQVEKTEEVVERFVHPVSGAVYIYQWPLDLQQLLRANAIWEQRRKLNAREMTLREIESSGILTIDQEFYATLLRFEKPNGDVDRYDPKHKDSTYNFVCSLSSEDFIRLEEVREDFFTKQGKSEIVSMEQFSSITPLLDAFAKISSLQNAQSVQQLNSLKENAQMTTLPEPENLTES